MTYKTEAALIKHWRKRGCVMCKERRSPEASFYCDGCLNVKQGGTWFAEASRRIDVCLGEGE